MGYNTRTMTRAGFALLLLLVPLTSYAAPASAQPVFIDTDPMGARVTLDGTLLAAATPVLLPPLAPGTHRVTLTKAGYLASTRTFEVADAVLVVEADLSPESVLVSFPSNAKVSAPGGDFDTAGRQFRFASGVYTMEPQDGSAAFTPVFPDQGQLDFAGWTFGLTAAAAAGSLASDVWHIQNRWTTHPSLMTAALGFAALMELPWFLSIHGAKDRFDKAHIPDVTPLPSPLVPAAALFQQADDALQNGDLDHAVASFGQFVRDFPESRLAPGAWFQLARIHALTGRREQALGEYRLVAETYPQAEYYDRSRQAMANLLEAAGKSDEALAQLNLLVFSDPAVHRDDVEAQKARLQKPQEASPAP